MLEPTGPLPPEIYWRRRVFAIGILVVVLALVIWLVVSVLRGGDSPGGTPAAAASSSATSPPAPPPAEPTTAGKSSAAGSSSSAPTSGSQPTSGTSGAQPTSGAAPNSGAPAAAGKCADHSLAVKVTVEQPTYQLGEEPVFGIVITNISAETCERDMGPGLQKVAVHTIDGEQQLWGSTDCFAGTEPDVRTLEGGEQAAFTVTWSGATSQPECAGERVPVPAGAYTVVAELGSIQSSAEPFNIA